MLVRRSSGVKLRRVTDRQRNTRAQLGSQLGRRGNAGGSPQRESVASRDSDRSAKELDCVRACIMPAQIEGVMVNEVPFGRL